MAGEWNGGRQEPSDPDALTPDVLERQAREAMAQIRERFGDLGSRVRRAMERASEHWDAAAPTPGDGNPDVPLTAGQRARTLARHWADVDFLVDPELAAGIAVHALDEGALWRVELRERGETRLLEERTAPYHGAQEPQHEALRAVWDYSFPTTPEIEAGDRRERVPGAGAVLACQTCSGTGQRNCRACDGAGRHTCVRCHGSGRLTCPRCRGRGRLTRPRTGAPPTQLHVDRLVTEAGEHWTELQDRVTHAWSKHFKPAFEWAPVDASDDETTVPCPSCQGGTVPCECDGGMQVCATCAGSGKTECGHCKGSGRLVRYPEVLRRFDTRIGTRTLRMDERSAGWVPEEALARTPGEIAWIGPLDEATSAATPPKAVPGDVWRDATAFASEGQAEAKSPETREGERRVISRRLALIRVPLVHLDYEFAGRRYTVTAYGAAGQERFWAERFPHRWSRVGRFLRAISRDLSEGGAQPVSEAKTGVLTTLDEVRARREAQARADGDDGSQQP